MQCNVRIFTLRVERARSIIILNKRRGVKRVVVIIFVRREEMQEMQNQIGALDILFHLHYVMMMVFGGLTQRNVRASLSHIMLCTCIIII